MVAARAAPATLRAPRPVSSRFGMSKLPPFNPDLIQDDRTRPGEGRTVLRNQRGQSTNCSASSRTAIATGGSRCSCVVLALRHPEMLMWRVPCLSYKSTEPSVGVLFQVLTGRERPSAMVLTG